MIFLVTDVHTPRNLNVTVNKNLSLIALKLGGKKVAKLWGMFWILKFSRKLEGSEIRKNLSGQKMTTFLIFGHKFCVQFGPAFFIPDWHIQECCQSYL